MARSLSLLLGLLCSALLVAAASAAQFRVGGQRGWGVPDANAEPYNAWAGRMRFQIGDQLLFVYPKEADSVLLVEPAAYNACNTSSYVNKFDDGDTAFAFDRSGPFFFISGNEARCRANEKLVVVVLADRTRVPPTTPPPSPAPLPSPAAAPTPSPPSATAPSAAPLPAPAATPSPAPSPAGSAPTTTPASSPPSPPASPSNPGGSPQPPSGSADAPSAEGGSTTTPPQPSGIGQSSASTTVIAGFVASMGAYIGYAMLTI